jgi:hypothetical protein
MSGALPPDTYGSSTFGDSTSPLGSPIGLPGARCNQASSSVGICCISPKLLTKGLAMRGSFSIAL